MESDKEDEKRNHSVFIVRDLVTYLDNEGGVNSDNGSTQFPPLF